MYCMMLASSVVFIFKQKTAYELLISDWSSDVCSSDLFARRPGCSLPPVPTDFSRAAWAGPATIATFEQFERKIVPNAMRDARPIGIARAPGEDLRSEEHTSELQSLMRISYAVFCLKKKNINKNKRINLPILHHTSTIIIIADIRS